MTIKNYDDIISNIQFAIQEFEILELEEGTYQVDGMDGFFNSFEDAEKHKNEVMDSVFLERYGENCIQAYVIAHGKVEEFDEAFSEEE